MYFWEIKKLKKDLVERPLSESESFKYLIATVILYSLRMIPFLDENLWNVYSALIAGVITAFGTYYIYKCNGGSNGNNFLQKYLSIGWVVGTRWAVLVTLPVMIVYIVYYAAVEIESTTLLDVVFSNLLYVAYFWLFGKHIKDLVNTVKN